jgi:hypothetical protein
LAPIPVFRVVTGLITSMPAFAISPTADEFLPYFQDLEGEFPSGQKNEGASPESGRMSPAQALNERNEESKTFP